MFMPVRGSTLQFLKYDVQMPELHDFTFCVWVKSSNFSHPHPLFSYSSELQNLWVFSSCDVMRSVILRIHPSVRIHASQKSKSFKLIYMAFEKNGMFKLKLANHFSFGFGWVKNNGNINSGLQMLPASTTTLIGPTFGIPLAPDIFVKNSHYNKNRRSTYNVTSRRCNNCCSWKAETITYCGCVFVALVIRHALRMRHIVVCSLSGSTILFQHYLINYTIFEKKKSYWT